MHEHTSQKFGGQMEIERQKQDLTKILGQLETISSRMRLGGYIISAFTLLNLLFLVILRFNAPELKSNDGYKLLLASQVISVIIAIVYAVLYERLRKQGDAMFEEVSDELQWNIRGAKLSEDKDIVASRPSLQARIVLRTFARASDLPLIPGKFGAGIYAAINLLALFIQIFLLVKQ